MAARPSRRARARQTGARRPLARPACRKEEYIVGPRHGIYYRITLLLLITIVLHYSILSYCIIVFIRKGEERASRAAECSTGRLRKGFYVGVAARGPGSEGLGGGPLRFRLARQLPAFVHCPSAFGWSNCLGAARANFSMSFIVHLLPTSRQSKVPK